MITASAARYKSFKYAWIGVTRPDLWGAHHKLIVEFEWTKEDQINK